MNSRTTWLLIAISFVLGTLLFWDTEVSEQVESVNQLIAVAAVIFAILGVFVSVLDPVAVLEKEPGRPDSARSELAQKFSPVWKQAAYAFAAVIAVRLLLPNAQNALLNLELLANWIFSVNVGEALAEALGQTTITWIATLLRTLSGIVICFLYLVEISILLFSLLPVAAADTEQNANEYEDTVANDTSELGRSRR